MRSKAACNVTLRSPSPRAVTIEIDAGTRATLLAAPWTVAGALIWSPDSAKIPSSVSRRP